LLQPQQCRRIITPDLRESLQRLDIGGRLLQQRTQLLPFTMQTFLAQLQAGFPGAFF
jgi:hypothetical protein